MEDLKKSDIVAEAFEKTQNIRKRNHDKVKKLFEHSATIISIAVIMLTIVLYAYNTGYFRVFNIPVEIIPLDLKSYIPFVIQICGIMMYVLYYITALRTDEVVKRKSFNFLRVLYGYYILTYLFNYNSFGNVIGAKTCHAIALAVPTLAECMILLRNRPRKDKKVDGITYKMALEDRINDMILYDLFIRYGLFALVIAVLLASPLGSMKAKANLSYQTCVVDEELYAVIADLNNMVLVENAEEEGNVLSIKTTSYRYIPKENLALTYQDYEAVDIG